MRSHRSVTKFRQGETRAIADECLIPANLRLPEARALIAKHTVVIPDVADNAAGNEILKGLLQLDEDLSCEQIFE